MTIAEELDQFVETLVSIPVTKRYWLIRTQSGSLYETFVDNKFIAIEHRETTLASLSEFKRESAGDELLLRKLIRNQVIAYHEKRLQELEGFEGPEQRTLSLISNQIYKFVFEMKIGDIVIIPSTNSDIISFGEITESHLGNFTPEEQRRMGLDAVLKRRVKWIKDIPRRKLDPYLYRMFTAHQALNDVGGYADVIERSLRDLFILDDEAHLIINIETEEEIAATEIFGLGNMLLTLVDRFSQEYQLGIDVRDLQVSITLNSPGKIDLKSYIKKTTVVSGLILAAFGGGYEGASGSKLKTDGIPGLIKAVSDFRDAEQQRDMREAIFNTYKDSLKIKDPDDMNKLIKQFSDNKDVAK